MRTSFDPRRQPQPIPVGTSSSKLPQSSFTPKSHGHRKRKPFDFTVLRRTNPDAPRFRKLRKKAHDEEHTRRWVASARDLSAYQDRFVIASYNILGDDNASKHADLYDGVHVEDLKWERRKRRICTELREYRPSILCLQEVDHFKDLEDLLEKDGFSGVYMGRTGEARDGCAIFWKMEQFTLLQKESIEFQKFELRHNVAQLCVFKMHLNQSYLSSCSEERSTNKEFLCSRIFIVCNIHVLYNPKRGDIKLGQMRLLLERAHVLSRKWDNAPVVIAGDLNSMPQSAIYQFLSYSELDILLYDRRDISLQIEFSSRYPVPISKVKYSWSEESIRLAVGGKDNTCLQHPLKLCSAYPGIPGNHKTRDNNGEPLVTSYHSKFMGTVDYIWHSDELVPVRVLDTLPISTLKKTRGLPTQKWGSDHFALVCELAFMNNSNSSKDFSDS